MLSCDVIIWDDNTPLFLFFLKTSLTPNTILILHGGIILVLDRDGIFLLLRSPGIDLRESIPPAYVACGILEQSMGLRTE